VLELRPGQPSVPEGATQDAPIWPGQMAQSQSRGGQPLARQPPPPGRRQGHHPPGSQGEQIVQRISRVIEVAQAPGIAIAAAVPHGE